VRGVARNRYRNAVLRCATLVSFGNPWCRLFLPADGSHPRMLSATHCLANSYDFHLVNSTINPISLPVHIHLAIFTAHCFSVASRAALAATAHLSCPFRRALLSASFPRLVVRFPTRIVLSNATFHCFLPASRMPVARPFPFPLA
jgi:hypothetical protein